MMNNYYSFKESIINQKKQKRPIRFRNGYTIKKKNYRETQFLRFIIWNITFFSLIPFVSASTVGPFVDKDYKLHEDYSYNDDALNTILPIFIFVIFLNFSGNSKSVKNVILPLLDDVLYNIITWMIPLIVSFSYDNLLSIKIFSIVNMCLHVNCLIIAIIDRKKTVESNHNYYTLITFFLFFPIVVFLIIWTNIIRDIVSFFYISYTMPIYLI
ncbi:hypothetical protein GLOIN_2v1701939 [Rhizophagus irregularis DAOM 181602=DAOM 197198]|nr:hypothetical protein GLOIN_2v1701939 [Rhizophagus irregularis DAOM 181602=DAOM 197198]